MVRERTWEGPAERVPPKGAGVLWEDPGDLEARGVGSIR